LKKYIGMNRGVAGCSFCQFLDFNIFVWLNLFYCESFEVIIHSSEQAQVPLEGGLPGNTFFFYLSNNHFRVGVKDASLDPSGHLLTEPGQYGLIFFYVTSAHIGFAAELHPCYVA
jgi:hypothetical protein